MNIEYYISRNMAKEGDTLGLSLDSAHKPQVHGAGNQ